MTYTCTDIKFIMAIMCRTLPLSFCLSLLFWISHSRLQLPDSNGFQISISSSLHSPSPSLCFSAAFQMNGPKWKWKSAVLQPVSQLAKHPFEGKPQPGEVMDFVFHKSLVKVVGVFYIYFKWRPLMSVLVKYVCLYTREHIQRNAVEVIYLYWKLKEACV